MLTDEEIKALQERGFKDGNEWFDSYATQEDRENAGSNELDRVGQGRQFFDWMMVEYPQLFRETTDETYEDMSDEELKVWSIAFMNAARECF